jgi:hypothetical protein
MVQILKVILDSNDAVIAVGSLPVKFDSRTDAICFMQRYIRTIFKDGRNGYQADEEYWWGCDETLELQLHLYSLTPLGCLDKGRSGARSEH